MADEHDDWLGGLGVNAGAILKGVSDVASSGVQAVQEAGSTVVQAAGQVAAPVMQALPEAAAPNVFPTASRVEAPAAQNLVAPGSTNAGILETAEAALSAAGEVTGVSGAVRQVKAAASSALDTAEKAGSIVADHPLDAAAGLAFGAVQGVAPGGFLVPSPDPKSQAFELGRGVGLVGGGVAAVAIGGGEEVGGTALDLTGIGALVGVPVNVLGAVTIASGVTAAGVGIATAGGALATGGGGSGQGPFRTNARPAEDPAQIAQEIKVDEEESQSISGKLKPLRERRAELDADFNKELAAHGPNEDLKVIADERKGVLEEIGQLEKRQDDLAKNLSDLKERQVAAEQAKGAP
jgi:hypothetical protein